MRTRSLSYSAGCPASPSLYCRLRQVAQEGRPACSPVQTGTLGSAGRGPTPTHGAAACTGAAPGQAVRVLGALSRVAAIVNADDTAALALHPASTWCEWVPTLCARPRRSGG